MAKKTASFWGEYAIGSDPIRGVDSGEVEYRRKQFRKDSSQVGKKSETQPKIEAPCKRFARGF